MPARDSGSSSNDVSLEEYEKIKARIKDLISKKKSTDKNLNVLEEQIFRAESVYIEDTISGNVVRGYDNYIKGSQTKKRAVLNEQDRIFSMSSAVFIKMKSREEDEKPI